MHKAFDITMDSITKIEGNAKIELSVKNGKVDSLRFIIADYRRFYTEAVKGKHFAAVPQVLSRICGTCSVAHIFASIESVERALGIHDQISEQTRTLRKLIIDGMIIRDHSLHLYIFSLPDVLGIDSVLDIPDDESFEHQLLHDAFDLKAIGNKLTTVFAGAPVHSPLPTIGGFSKLPLEQDFAPLIDELEKSREKAIRAVKVFYDWDKQLQRPTDYMALNNDDYNYLEGTIHTSGGHVYQESQFRELLEEIVVPYSQSKGFLLKEEGKNEEYLVGAIARMNLNRNNLHKRTKQDLKNYMGYFPSSNIIDNCLAQAIETLHSIDRAIDCLKSLIIVNEKPIRPKPQAGVGVGVIEAPRGILYHKIELDDSGMVNDSDVIVPTSQNQIHIESSIRQMFQENLDKMSKDELKHEAEVIIRAYDPCMSCATNFLEVEWQEEGSLAVP